MGAKKQAVVDTAGCVACGSCEDVCPRGAIKVWHGSYAKVDKALCVGCGLCARTCPGTFIHLEEVRP